MRLLTLLILLPLIEIAGFVAIGPYLGVSGTLAFVIASALIGSWRLRREGIGMLRRLQISIAAGATPVPAALDSACRIVASLLLIVPGFISSAVGLLLFLPPVRRIVVHHLGVRIMPGGGMSWHFHRKTASTVVIETDYREI